MKAKEKLFRSIDEEEKVPNEHPMSKRHSIGLNFYQTNYFTQSVDNQACYKQYEVSDEEFKEGALHDMIRNDSLSL